MISCCHSSDSVHPLPTLHSDAHLSPALRLTADRVEARLEKSLGKGKPLDFCVFMERGYDPTISANTLFDGLLALPESVVPWSTLLPTPKARLPPGGRKR